MNSDTSLKTFSRFPMFRWAFDGVGPRIDNCNVSNCKTGLAYLNGMDRLLPQVLSKYDQPLDLEGFVTPLNNNYHANGHNAVGDGQYRTVFSTLIGPGTSGLGSDWLDL